MSNCKNSVFQVGPRPHKDKKKLPQIETRETQYSPVVGNPLQDQPNQTCFRTLSRSMKSTNLSRNPVQQWGSSMLQRRRCKRPWMQQQRCFAKRISKVSQTCCSVRPSHRELGSQERALPANQRRARLPCRHQGAGEVKKRKRKFFFY